jgi:hypothetical protein
MRYVLSLVVAATVLGATQARSEEVGLVRVRWVDDGVAVGASLNGCYDMYWNIAATKEGESELPVMIAIIERNREDRERDVASIASLRTAFLADAPVNERARNSLHSEQMTGQLLGLEGDLLWCMRLQSNALLTEYGASSPLSITALAVTTIGGRYSEHTLLCLPSAGSATSTSSRLTALCI